MRLIKECYALKIGTWRTRSLIFYWIKAATDAFKAHALGVGSLRKPRSREHVGRFACRRIACTTTTIPGSFRDRNVSDARNLVGCSTKQFHSVSRLHSDRARLVHALIRLQSSREFYRIENARIRGSGTRAYARGESQFNVRSRGPNFTIRLRNQLGSDKVRLSGGVPRQNVASRFSPRNEFMDS